MTDGSAEELLRAEGLWKTYPDGDVHALNGVSLAVREAEYVAITGPSGCGKSTLLNVLGALDRPDKGEVYFRGEPLSDRADLDSFRARQIGFVFQSFFLLPTLTARENVQVPMFEGPPRSASERAAPGRCSARSRRNERPIQPPLRAAVGRGTPAGGAGAALANDPVLLLADEPTGNLDSANAEMVLDLFASCASERKLALLVITHSPEVAERADRVISMKDGRVVDDGSRSAATPG